VHESNVFIPFGLLLSEKQIPGFVETLEVMEGAVGIELRGTNHPRKMFIELSTK